MKSYKTKQAKFGDVIKLPKDSLEYLVIGAGLGGGGTGHGPTDIYPDGWQVTIQKLDEAGSYNPKTKRITFYQSGCFSNKILEVEVVGKMKRIVNYIRIK